MSQRRSANTCAECRARKVKCDSRREICSPCERLRLRCSFRHGEDGAQAAPDPEALETRRAQVACQACRALRVRCSGDKPRCQRCTEKGNECVFLATKRKSIHARDGRGTAQTPPAIQASETQIDIVGSGTPSAHATPHIPTTPRALINAQTIPCPAIPAEVTAISPLLDGPMVMRVLDAFFLHIHPLPIYSFFHRASLMHRFETGVLKPGLLLALIGTTCEMLDMGPSFTEIAQGCLSKAEAIVMEDIKTPSTIKTQTLLLIVKAHCRQNRMTAAFVLFAVAARFAYALKLNHEAPNLCFLEQEARRRLMWSLFILDMALAGGIPELALCPAESLYIQLPCQERNFEFDLEQKTEPLQPMVNPPMPGSLGSFGAYLRICWLRYRILQTTKEAVLSKGDAATIVQLPTRMEQLAMDLANYEANLPPDLRFSEKNLQLQAYSPGLYPYLSIHIWCRQCYCDLYRVVLTGLKEALREDQLQHLDPSIVSKYFWECYESAKALSNVLGSIQTLKNKVLTMDTEIQISGYQCVRLLLQCYRLRGRTINEDAKTTFHELINQCVAAVEAMPSTSPWGQRVERDFKKLIRQGRSTEASPTRSTSRMRGLQRRHVPPAVSHLFSRHSLVGQMEIEDDSADLTIRDDLDQAHSPPPSSAVFNATFSAALSDPVTAFASSHLDSQRQTDWSDLASFNEFHGDLGDPFNNDMTSLDLFGWTGDYWADTL